MSKHNELGKRGEEIASEFLIQSDYRIAERNWRTGRAEIDIIAYDRHVLVFVEVKTRVSDELGKPEEAVTTKKRKLMIQAAIEYTNKNRHDGAIRFDVISVIIKNKKSFITHLPDVFFPGIDV